MSATTFDVIAVDMTTHRVRLLATGKDERDAEAVVKMAIARQGVDAEFFLEVGAGQYKDGDEWDAPE